MANLAKTMPFACCPPAFVRSHGGGLFSPQTSQKQLFSTQTGWSAKMDSLLSPPNEQRHKDNVAPLVPEPTAVTARLGGPMQDFDGWFASATMALQPNEATAEETRPSPSVQMPIQNEA